MKHLVLVLLSALARLCLACSVVGWVYSQWSGAKIDGDLTRWSCGTVICSKGYAFSFADSVGLTWEWESLPPEIAAEVDWVFAPRTSDLQGGSFRRVLPGVGVLNYGGGGFAAQTIFSVRHEFVFAASLLAVIALQAISLRHRFGRVPVPAKAQPQPKIVSS